MRRFGPPSARTEAFVEKLLPRDTVEIMINFGGVQKLHLSGSKTTAFRRSWVSGMHTGCLEVESTSSAQLIAASLRPSYTRTVLNVTGSEIAGAVVPLDGVLGAAAEELAGRLEECPSAAGRFLLFEDFLRDRLRRGTAPTPSVARAVDCIAASAGQVSVQTIATQLNCSTRHLQQRMSEEVGLTPKQLSRLYRFNSAIERLRVPHPVDWSQLAASCGYFDQSHFHRDFMHFAGVTPAAFIELRDPSSQAILET